MDKKEMKLLLEVNGKKDAERVGRILGIKWRMVYYRKNALLNRLRPLEAYLRKNKKAPLLSLSKKFDVTYNEIQYVVDKLKVEGVLIEVNEGKIKPSSIEPYGSITLPKSDYHNQWIRFGVVSDTHLNSKYQRLDILNELYDIFEEESVHTVLHAGNIIDGYSRLNAFDVFNRGIEEQIKYLINVYPQREGIITHFITADDHEGWWVQREHVNIGQIIEDTALNAGRKDLHHLGYLEANVEIDIGAQRKTVIRVMHPGGGTSYAVSYAPQKIIESLEGGQKPDFMIIGHYHKMLSGVVRNVPYILAGTTEEQTPFMRKKHLSAHLGGWLVDLHISPGGYITRIRTEQIRSFNREFYMPRPRDKHSTDRHQWQYKW